MIKYLTTPQHATCQCGACSFELAESTAVARFICHCTICQQFNNNRFADVTLFKAKALQSSSYDNVEFKKYRLPPNINRGVCKLCGEPALEIGGVGPVKIAFIPTNNFKDSGELPPPAIHMFYHRRIEDIVDDLPKYEGYVSSELAVMKLMYGVLKA
ncbi:GFA family protein [Vibrio hepatarius]|uniref:GFA family protein n=1 Tax=Vibrio hepatarius TaxID=171383 RepID=UPI00142D264D|nr:GFA family protein [Vibrio hepatarius]NIY84382.1 hypothetical protein [Vibrio hepatarius]NVJ57676.1 GFA family protein [Vibrionaceae bacterium]